MFSFWARRKGGKKKKVEIIFTPLKKAEEQLAGSIFSLSTYTHAFCHLAEFGFSSCGKGKRVSRYTVSEAILRLCYADFKGPRNPGLKIYFLKKQVYTTRDTEPFIHCFHWLRSNVRFVYFNDCAKYSSCKVSEIFGFPPAI